MRVGLEDSLWSGPGRLASSNAEQVRAARQIIEGLGLSVASPDEAREILQLKGGDRVALLTPTVRKGGSDAAYCRFSIDARAELGEARRGMSPSNPSTGSTAWRQSAFLRRGGWRYALMERARARRLARLSRDGWSDRVLCDGCYALDFASGARRKLVGCNAFRCTADGREVRAWDVLVKIGSMALRKNRGAVLSLASIFHYLDFKTGEAGLIVDPAADKAVNRG